MGARPDTDQFCGLCGEPSGTMGKCSCTVDCGDLLCGASVLHLDADWDFRPPVPSFR